MIAGIPRALVEELLRQCRGRYPAPACGVLLGTPGDPVSVEASRSARPATPPCAGPAPDEVEAAAREGASRGISVVGGWHAHPDASAEPTAADSAGLRPGRVLLVISVRNGQAAEWACWTAADGACEPVILRLAST